MLDADATDDAPDPPDGGADDDTTAPLDANDAAADASGVDADAQGPPEAGDESDGDTDAGCACTPVGNPPVQQAGMPLSCYCAMNNCPSYDQALLLSCQKQSRRLDVYAACNLERMVFSVRTDLETYVYDATTHALVGLTRQFDTPFVPCGGQYLTGYQIGTMPPSGCAITRSTPLCEPDGSDAR